MALEKIEAIKREIQKLEDQIIKLEKEENDPRPDKNIRADTIELLKNVISDLRMQQEKLILKPEDRSQESEET